jgi:hypothetical protein
MRTIATPILLFLLGGIAGPLLRWTTWPPGRVGDGTGISISDLVYDLVLMLWPMQALGVIDVSTGRATAVAISVGANLLLFATAGLLAGMLARRPAQLVAMYLSVCVILVLLTVWSAGYSLTLTNLIALLVAFVLYAVLFFATFRMIRVAR